MATAEQIIYPHITRDPEVCGGRACVAGTRVRVLDVVAAHRTGLGPEQILREYPSLGSVYDVYAALVYWNDHKDEIAAALEEDDRVAQRIQRDREQFLKESPVR